MKLVDVASKIGNSSRAVERATAKLVQQGRLEFVGLRKTGRWQVIE